MAGFVNTEMNFRIIQNMGNLTEDMLLLKKVSTSRISLFSLIQDALLGEKQVASFYLLYE